MELISYNLAKGKKVGSVEASDKNDVKRVVLKAKWKKIPVNERVKFVAKFTKKAY